LNAGDTTGLASRYFLATYNKMKAVIL